MKTELMVHVVAWRSAGSGGFDWYHTREAADRAFEVEKANARTFRDEGWVAYRFDFTAGGNDPTAEIDDDFDHLCDRAPISYSAP